MIVYVIAFQHKTPGEGVGGFDWYSELTDAEKAELERVESGFYGPDYEHAIFTYEADGLTGDELTRAIDAEYIDLLCEAVALEAETLADLARERAGIQSLKGRI